VRSAHILGTPKERLWLITIYDKTRAAQLVQREVTEILLTRWATATYGTRVGAPPETATKGDAARNRRGHALHLLPPPAFPTRARGENGSISDLFPRISLQEVLDGEFTHRADLRNRAGDSRIKEIAAKAQQFCTYQFRVQIIQDRTYEEVADIFARVNSLATPLTGAEIHLARLVACNN
jgi:hypothetical protein